MSTPPSSVIIRESNPDADLPGLMPAQLDLEVFPNPSGGLVNLQYAGFDNGRVLIFIHNSAGELVHQMTLGEKAAQVSLDLAGNLKLAGGMYFITASSGKQTISKKLIIDYNR